MVSIRGDATTAPGLHSRSLVRDQSFLGRLVGEDGGTLDCSCPRWCAIWHWISVPVHGAAELLGRRVRNLRCVCDGSCILHSLEFWSGSTIRSETNV